MRTAAWSVPAISLASAAPAFATSLGGPEIPGLRVLPVRSWTASAQEAEEMPDVGLFPGDGLIVGAYMVYLPEDPAAPSVVHPTLTVRLPMWTEDQDLAIAGNWIGVANDPMEPEWQLDKPGPATTSSGPLLSSDGELRFSMPQGLPAGQVTAVLAQMDVSDHLAHGSPGSVSIRVTPPGTSDFVSARVMSFAEFHATGTGFLAGLPVPGEARRMSREATRFPFPGI